MPLSCTPAALEPGAAPYRRLSARSLQKIKTLLLCNANTSGGLGGNIVPPGSTYGSGTPTYTLSVQPTTTYDVMWGSNDVSMSLCGTVYNSTGAGTNTVVYTGACTQMVFTGNATGTTVTVHVTPQPRAPAPPSAVSLALNGTGTNVVATWDATPSNISQSFVQTSSDGVNWSNLGFFNSPTNSANIGLPGASAIIYCRVRWFDYNGQGSSFTAVAQYAGAAADWANRVVANGGARPSAGTIAAVNTFYTAIASFASLFKTLNVVAPDSVFAAITPLIKNNGSDPWTPNGGSGSVGVGVVTVNGWQATGDTGSHYLDPGITPSGIASFSASNGGMTIYAFTLISEGSNVGQCGCTDAASRRFQLDLNDSSGPGSVAIMCNDFGTSQSGGGVASSKGAGFYSENRVDASNHFCYYAKSSTAFGVGFSRTGVTNVNTPPQVAFLFAGYNTNGAKNASGSRYSFFAIHDALTSAQAQTLYNAVQAMRTSFGGGFV